MGKAARLTKPRGGGCPPDMWKSGKVNQNEALVSLHQNTQIRFN